MASNRLARKDKTPGMMSRKLALSATNQRRRSKITKVASLRAAVCTKARRSSGSCFRGARKHKNGPQTQMPGVLCRVNVRLRVRGEWRLRCVSPHAGGRRLSS